MEVCLLIFLFFEISEFISFLLFNRKFADLFEKKKWRMLEVRTQSIQIPSDHFNSGVFVCQYFKRLLTGNQDMNFTKSTSKETLSAIRQSMSDELRQFQN